MQTYTLEQSNKHIAQFCDDLKEHLIRKNTDYNDAALNPQGTFALLSPSDTIRVRIDDKLNRLRRQATGGAMHFHEDTLLDLTGYLVLLRIAQTRESHDAEMGAAQEEMYADEIPEPQDDDVTIIHMHDAADLVPEATAPAVTGNVF